MNAVVSIDERVLFGVGLRPETDSLLQRAVALRVHDREEAEHTLWEAQRRDPDCLPVYFALYKFYANGKRLPEAERAARLALAEAARQGGFAADWRELARASASATLYAAAGGPFYLFSLKALAFVTLRQGRAQDAGAILDDLRSLDPEDRSGGSVVRALLDSLDGGREEAA